MEKFQPIFIVGVGRSGTSLLQSMLNAHSKIAFPPETHFIRNYIKKKSSFRKEIKNIINDKYLKNLNLNIEETILSARNFVDFYTNLLKDFAKSCNKDYVGDKDPKNIENIKQINKFFPNAIIVNIYRDPRAVIASRIKAVWSQNKPLWQHLLAYKAQFNYLINNKNHFKNYIEIKFEELIINPEKELSKILSLLDLKFENNMLSFYEKSNDVVFGKEYQWKKNLFKPVMIKNIDKWQSELSPQLIKKIEKTLYPEMKKKKYIFNNKSIISSFFYSIIAKIYILGKCN
ncbi:MAG: sulfotransferase [Halanaerobiales bacterium]|nr:sulfotransferase [Halanaerobiales bacterium]